MSPIGLHRSYHPGAFAPTFAGDPAPAALPASPMGYFATAVLNARAVGVAPADRPQQFIVADMLRGPSNGDYGQSDIDPLTLACGIETEALLGINALEIILFGTYNATAAALAASWGITRFVRAQYAPPAYFTWQAGAGDSTAWAEGLATFMADTMHLPPSQTVLIPMADEPLWYYPDTVADATHGLANSSAGLTSFRDYLAAKGFAPADFGGSVWTDVLPAMGSVVVPPATPTLADARRYVWTMRFIADDFATMMATNTAALRAVFPATVLPVINFNNYTSRWFFPAPGQIIGNNTDTTADAAGGSVDWMQMGRAGSVGALWSEDWIDNSGAQNWSLWGDALKSAAALTPGLTFGGYLIGLALTGSPASGGRYKALALLGRGAKALLWYNFGPTELFVGNGWSANSLAYASIADANRLIARSEDLLFPGQPVATRIALLLPGMARCWDFHDPATGLDTPVFDYEMTGIHYALMHAGHMVDFLAEDDVATRLTNYDLLYVAAPHLSQAAQTALANWVTAGGVAWFGPGAGARDEYDQPCTILNAARGITAQAMAPKWRNEDSGTTDFTLTMLDVTVNGVRFATPGTDAYWRHTERLVVTTATPLATFDDDSTPALVAQATGSGWAISSGVWFGAYYFGNADRWSAPEHFAIFNARVRGLLTAPTQLAAVVKAVTVDAPMIEAQRLDSDAGVAITLLNWDDATPQSALTVTVSNCPTMTRAVRADSLEPVAFTQNGGTVTVTMPLATVDVLKLYAA